MGKGRKGRRQASREEDSNSGESGSGDEDPSTTRTNAATKTPIKDLDFAQRRAVQRQQAAAKRRSKQKCYLCGRAGHVRRECPGIPDDGRGMSHYKGKSDKQSEKQKIMERRKQRGSSGNHEVVEADLLPHYPEAFMAQVEVDSPPPLHYYDVHCNISASIEYLRYGRGKAKISRQAAVSEYRQALFLATGLSAMISQTFLLKPGRPWTNPLVSDLGLAAAAAADDDDDIQVRIFFVLGLTEAFKCSCDALRKEATENLVSTVREHADQIIAIGSTLDYSPEAVASAGRDSHSQLQRIWACWQAAGRAKVPWQLRLLPGVASLDPNEESVAGTDYAKVLLDGQAQIAAAVALYPDLLIHIVGWCGKAVHLMALLQAFPQNLRAVGFDGTVSFKSRPDLHECVFDVPLDRLLLETSTIIPSQVNHRLGRSAFFHSGWWPFVAESVAHHKKTASIEQFVQAVNENAERIYPQLVGTKIV